MDEVAVKFSFTATGGSLWSPFAAKPVALFKKAKLLVTIAYNPRINQLKKWYVIYKGLVSRYAGCDHRLARERRGRKPAEFRLRTLPRGTG
jgi:hypothetical protein